MSTVTPTINSTCPVFQAMLERYFKMCASRPSSALFTFLNSPMNRSTLRDIIHWARGKKRVAKMIFDQPILPDGATTPSTWDMICDATTKRGDLAVEFDIDPTDAREFEEQINLADWNESCRTNGELIMGKIIRLIDALMTSLYAKVAADMPPILGGYASTVNVNADDFLEVATEKPSSEDLNVKAMQKISTAKMKTGFCAPTFGVGGSDLYEYYQIMRAGCCTNDGINALAILQQLGEVFTYDHYVEQEFGTDVSLLLQLGSVQLLNYNGWANYNIDLPGIGALASDSVRIGWHGVILDPETGYPIDISIKEDCNVMHIVVRALAKPVGLPFDLFGVGSIFEGVNWATGVQVVNS